MQVCNKCIIKIRGRKECCPLCQGKLTNTEGIENPAFPVLEKRRVTSITFFKICTFIFISLEIIFGTINIMTGGEYSFIGPIMLGALVAWIDIYATMYLRNNLIKVITFEVLVAIVVDFYIDIKTGFHGWSVNWMIPMTLIGLAIVTIATALILKLRLDEYILYIVFDFIMALLQIITIRNGMNSLPWPAASSIMFYLILIAALVIFRFRDLKNASEKMFNI
ncbi:hypothetical protein D6855_02505 [Butyrivibrio sp. CB08]|uniref:DUF6320 domain-containing protein n=1 Tax=Butyrivibrio sp. CB08 TaxID=2364879 RepID=UPI000EA877E7|nr:DUF6320 domain-containing protein [Butyrivibrio sp. CB08]RKM62308.1 hypothetical protein D6855_02505 [Butyrivibrio sp. CB08]